MEIVNSVTRLKVTHIFLISIFFTNFYWFNIGAESPKELFKGFKATPDSHISNFQPLLTDSTGNYSLSFLRVEKDQLTLSIIHVPSSESIWVANLTRLARWADSTELFFNGSLVLSDSRLGVFWSTHTNGHRVWLSNTSNLQVQKVDSGMRLSSVLWQSFDFPSDTLVENQNFTSKMTLVSSNGLYSMSLGFDFFGLYAKFKNESGPGPGRIYWKHKALEAKADVIEGQGPIYAVLKSDGFFGMYQNESVPVDVESFNSFQQPVSGVRRIRVEPDGNLKGYFWAGSSWILDYQAIKETCELPNPCGIYGLCRPGKGCSCLDNSTDYNSGKCVSPENQDSGDFCGVYDHKKYKGFSRNGVELPNKELMTYQKMASFQECQSTCEGNCTCWGVVYTNTSGFCYILDYPIQSLVGVGDETKMGFFKVREGVGKDKVEVGLGIGIGLLCGAILVFGGVIGLGLYRYRKRKRGVSGYVEEDGMVVGPYKEMGNASFRSIELSER
ncbi:PREDICTED: PAN domain-containing protein At5g03700-like [Nicotiana attenuata]|uniref:Pan domain-containing protein n=1 Tax=Nicotiana attenuata TaxID=49451 RepID=A0A314L7K3_NICAT|nr:PREDICTED: PAN domain-containing protein At5g03700-like [Nicotiana attenuata]OIT37542.1 pan domain-containing protein [Nicotiana attenuata]